MKTNSKISRIGFAVIVVCVFAAAAIQIATAESGQIATVIKIDPQNGDVIIKPSSSNTKIAMGDKFYVTVDGTKLTFEATFPMQTVTKCRIAAASRANLSKIKAGMSVYSLSGSSSTAVTQTTATTTTTTGTAGATKNISGIEFIYLPGGTFKMGVPEDNTENVYLGEAPNHTVTVAGFWIGKYEITQKQYSSITGTNPSKFKGDNLPVENVCWNDADMFCKAFSFANSVNVHLPYEAQWEYAARAGTDTVYYWGSTTNGDYCWYSNNSDGKTHPVGQKLPNKFGLYDMSGNVFEWVFDWYDEGYYASSPSLNPQGPASGDRKIIRGGSYVNVDFHPSPLRSDIRCVDPATTKNEGWGAFGFRIVLE